MVNLTLLFADKVSSVFGFRSRYLGHIKKLDNADDDDDNDDESKPLRASYIPLLVAADQLPNSKNNNA